MNRQISENSIDVVVKELRKDNVGQGLLVPTKTYRLKIKAFATM